MSYCPLMSFSKQYTCEVECLGEGCALAADNNGECLIKQALQCYVEEKRSIKQENENAVGYLYDNKGTYVDTIKFIEKGERKSGWSSVESNRGHAR